MNKAEAIEKVIEELEMADRDEENPMGFHEAAEEMRCNNFAAALEYLREWLEFYEELELDFTEKQSVRKHSTLEIKKYKELILALES